MASHPEVLAVIGARSGSKGIPDKNIRPLLGRPLMSWIIEAATRARLVGRVVLSTDSEAYAEVGRQCGAEVPFLRPGELAEDLSTDYEYVRHALEWLGAHEAYVPDIVVRLFPSTPLTRPEAIDATITALVEDPDAHSAVLITESLQTPYKMYVPGADPRYLEPLLPQPDGASMAPVPRQRLPKTYVRGNMIASRYSTIMTDASLFGEKVRYHVVPQLEAIDIDHDYDFLVAEAILERRA
jgi:CMP-N,N'-diacetyllegionaminic acid synthase